MEIKKFIDNFKIGRKPENQIGGVNFESIKKSLLENNRKLNDKEVLGVLWQSFLFSQGNVALQENLLRFCVLYYGQQKLPGEKVSSLSEVFIEKWLGSPNKDTNINPIKLSGQGIHKPFVSSAETRQGLEDYLYILTEVVDRFNLGIILAELIFRDEKYFNLVKEHTILGRYGSNKKIDGQEDFKEGPLSDRYFSYIVSYFLRENKTGYEWADKLFETLRSDPAIIAKHISNIEKIIEVYNVFHPSSLVTKEELEKFKADFVKV